MVQEWAQGGLPGVNMGVDPLGCPAGTAHPSVTSETHCSSARELRFHIGDNRVGMTVAHAVLGLQPGDDIHVAFGVEAVRHDVQPVLYRTTVGLLDAGEVGRRALRFSIRGQARRGNAMFRHGAMLTR